MTAMRTCSGPDPIVEGVLLGIVGRRVRMGLQEICPVCRRVIVLLLQSAPGVTVAHCAGALICCCDGLQLAVMMLPESAACAVRGGTCRWSRSLGSRGEGKSGGLVHHTSQLIGRIHDSDWTGRESPWHWAAPNHAQDLLTCCIW